MIIYPPTIAPDNLLKIVTYKFWWYCTQNYQWDCNWYSTDDCQNYWYCQKAGRGLLTIFDHNDHHNNMWFNWLNRERGNAYVTFDIWVFASIFFVPKLSHMIKMQWCHEQNLHLICDCEINLLLNFKFTNSLCYILEKANAWEICFHWKTQPTFNLYYLPAI